MSQQTRLQSAIESIANVVVGYVVALASQLLVFPMFGIHIPFSSNIAIGAWFTVISLARSYVLRRWFNGLKFRQPAEVRPPMTLLHQAAQKAVEALHSAAAGLDWYRDMCPQFESPADAEMTEQMEAAVEALESALQQQPEPVAPIGWLYDWTHSSALGKPDEQFTGFTTDEAHARKHDSPRAVYAAPPALQHQEVPSTAVIPPAPPECETEDEKTAFSFGYWQGLHAARKGQEVPREPVAVARPLTSEEEENAWNSITEQGCSCCTGAVRLFCRLNGITLSDAVLAASPSTTRQQEVGSGWKLVPVEPTPEMIAAYLRANYAYWKRTDELPTPPNKWRTGTPSDATAESYRAMLAAAPSTPENADGGPHG